ncbi:MAG: hypothetical protein M1840_007996 [Geoglossum simile]|nr:MAG: hypothetical protein M1840_007996 [Geoglossum simile]
MHKRRRVAEERPEAEPQPPERVPSRKVIDSPLVIQPCAIGLGRPLATENVEAGSWPGLGPHITLRSTTTVGNTNQGLTRRRGHLKLRMGPRTGKTTVSADPPLASPPWGRPLLPSDSDVTAAIPISSPPRIKNRRKAERFARAFALVAYRTSTTTFRTTTVACSEVDLSHAWVFPEGYSAPQFLVCLFSISRNFRYSAILAFTFLTHLGFAGRRSDVYIQSKATDPLIHDLRPWYFHRRAEMSSRIREMGRWWGERVWRYMLSSDWSTNKHGLYFSGISSHLLGNPDHPAQWDVARRFWIQRFSTYVSGMGNGCQQLLRDLQAQMIISCEPLLPLHPSEAFNESNVSPFPEIWRLETKDGGIFFIIGRTGEVLGWNSHSAQGQVLNLTPLDMAGTPPQESVIKSNICTQPYRATANEAPRLGQCHKIGYEDVAWRNLRRDWKAYVSIIYSNGAISMEPILQPLIQRVFYPSLSKTHPHGINNTIILPRHYALAERFILTHVHAGGVSGPQLLPPIAARKPQIALDLEHKWTVESVRCSGERYRTSMTTGLAPGVGFVQTPEAGWFVLEETGQEIAMEEYGIQGLWATILGVKEDGSALPKEDTEALRSCFVRD